MWEKNAGAEKMDVTPNAAISSAVWFRLGRLRQDGHGTPKYNAANTSNIEMSKKKLTATPMTSSFCHGSTSSLHAHRVCEVAAPTITPFGTPVDPDVNST